MRAVKREHALPVYNRYSSYYTAVFVDRMQNNAKVKAFRAQFRGVRDIPKQAARATPKGSLRLLCAAPVHENTDFVDGTSF